MSDLPTREQIEELRKHLDDVRRGGISPAMKIKLVESVCGAAELALDLQAKLVEVERERNAAQKKLDGLLNNGGNCGHANRFFVDGDCLVCLSWSQASKLHAAERELAALKAQPAQ